MLFICVPDGRNGPTSFFLYGPTIVLTVVIKEPAHSIVRCNSL